MVKLQSRGTVLQSIVLCLLNIYSNKNYRDRTPKSKVSTFNFDLPKLEQILEVNLEFEGKSYV